MAHHQHASAPFGQLDKSSTFLDVETQRLLDEHVLAGLESLADERRMGLRRRCDNNALDVAVGQNLVYAFGTPNIRELLRDCRTTHRVGVAHPPQDAELVEVPDVVPAPVTCSDTPDAQRSHALDSNGGWSAETFLLAPFAGAMSITSRPASRTRPKRAAGRAP